MFYTIDRRPETVQKLGRPAIEAHSLLAAAKGRAAADTGIYRRTASECGVTVDQVKEAERG